jgi:hypothetical protein
MTDEVLVELKKMNKLLAMMITKDINNIDKIVILSKAGYQAKEIAELIDSTPNTVSVTLYKMKKNKK